MILEHQREIQVLDILYLQNVPDFALGNYEYTIVFIFITL